MASCMRLVEAALRAVKQAKEQDPQATRRELRGLALTLADACRHAGEQDLAGAIDRTLWVTSGQG